VAKWNWFVKNTRKKLIPKRLPAEGPRNIANSEVLACFVFWPGKGPERRKKRPGTRTERLSKLPAVRGRIMNVLRFDKGGGL
jgi:hypothetical protein